MTKNGPKITYFEQNFDFRSNFNFGPKFRYWSKISIFDQNVDQKFFFRLKFLVLIKIPSFKQKFTFD